MNRIDFDQLGAYLRSEHPTAWDTDAAWTELRSRMPSAWLGILKLAAGVVIALGIGVTWLQWQSRNDQSAAPIATFKTGVGERRTVQLKDGSAVELAAASVLRIVSFSSSRRLVQLDGEGFFNVTHDGQRPFIVRAKESETRVLGTTFDVNAYADAAGVDVVVASGRVELRDTVTRKAVILEPNQAGHLERGEMAVRSMDATSISAWRRGQLSFRATRFEDVASALQRWYGVQIAIQDRDLADTTVNVFLPQQSLNEVLDVLAETLNARYERAGTRITFYRK